MDVRETDDSYHLATLSLRLEKMIAEHQNDASSPVGSWATAAGALQWVLDLATEALNGHLVVRTTPYRREASPIDGEFERWAFWFNRAELSQRAKDAMFSTVGIAPDSNSRYLFHIRCQWVSPQEVTGEMRFNVRSDKPIDEVGMPVGFPVVYNLAWQEDRWVVRPQSRGDDWQSFNAAWMMEVLSRFFHQHSPNRPRAPYVFDGSDLFDGSEYKPRLRVSWRRRLRVFLGLDANFHHRDDNQ